MWLERIEDTDTILGTIIKEMKTDMVWLTEDKEINEFCKMMMNVLTKRHRRIYRKTLLILEVEIAVEFIRFCQRITIDGGAQCVSS